MSADTTPGLEAERAAFEAVFSAPPYEFDLARQPEKSAWPGSYRSYHVQCAWDAWQEGRRGVTPAASGMSDLEISAHITREIPSLIGDAMALRVARAVLARWGAPAASGEPVTRYRLLEPDTDRIEATDEFLSNDTLTWAIDAGRIFVGMPYAPRVLRPARRAIKP